jgi:hypothetical protein
MSLVIRPGCYKASRLGNETTHRPSEQACALDTEHLITRAASSASWAISNGRPLSVERPIPRLSRRMSSLEDASLSINEGPQSALVAPKPFRTTSGRPCPIRPQAICAPSTWSFSNDSLGIGDVRKSRNDGQDACGGSASPKTMGDKSPRAQDIIHRGAVAHLFANGLRTTGSTLKQAFSSRNVSILAWQYRIHPSGPLGNAIRSSNSLHRLNSRSSCFR